ncbi:unnamed protein product [Lampetra planeri]
MAEGTSYYSDKDEGITLGRKTNIRYGPQRFKSDSELASPCSAVSAAAAPHCCGDCKLGDAACPERGPGSLGEATAKGRDRVRLAAQMTFKNQAPSLINNGGASSGRVRGMSEMSEMIFRRLSPGLGVNSQRAHCPEGHGVTVAGAVLVVVGTHSGFEDDVPKQQGSQRRRFPNHSPASARVPHVDQAASRTTHHVDAQPSPGMSARSNELTAETRASSEGAFTFNNETNTRLVSFPF